MDTIVKLLTGVNTYSGPPGTIHLSANEGYEGSENVMPQKEAVPQLLAEEHTGQA